MTIQLDYLPIIDAEIPVEKNFSFNNKTYAFTFRYNSENDFYTMEIRLESVVLYSTKLVYGSNLVHAEVENLDLDCFLYAFNVDDLTTDQEIDDQSVNSDNFGTRVLVYKIDDDSVIT